MFLRVNFSCNNAIRLQLGSTRLLRALAQTLRIRIVIATTRSRMSGDMNKTKNIRERCTANASCRDAATTFVSVLSQDAEATDFNKEIRLAPQAPVESSSLPSTKKRREMRFLLFSKRIIVERNIERSRRRPLMN